jgi:DNA-binding transcriptional LysR family regulator
MELHQVRYFLALCDERNFTRAANRCGVRQPSLTNGIKALERHLGGELFVRTAPVQLSDLGREVLPYLRAIEAGAREAKRISALHLKARANRNAPYTASLSGG